MKLFTKAITAKAQAQFHLGTDMEKQVIVAKFFNSFDVIFYYHGVVIN